jgi:hypothetical protein
MATGLSTSRARRGKQLYVASRISAMRFPSEIAVAMWERPLSRRAKLDSRFVPGRNANQSTTQP